MSLLYAWGTNEANEATRVKPGVLDAEAYGVKSTSADLIRFVQAKRAASFYDLIVCAHFR